MFTNKRICICGGGGLGHTCAAVLSSHPEIEVMMYTQHPEKWQQQFIVDDPNGKQYHGHLTTISNDPSLVITTADIILLCLPAFLVEQTLQTIKPYLSTKAIIGSVVGNTGFFLFAHKVLENTNTGLFAFQRVPYISRVIEYGKRAALLGYKNELHIAVENISEPQEFSNEISALFCTKTQLVDSFYEVTLSNSNPILHTGRLYTMWKDWAGESYTEKSLFYYDWTDETSELLIKMDQEFFQLLQVLGVSTVHLPTLLQHYEVSNANELTNKIKNIQSFATIQSPMKEKEGRWIPDFTSRYFTEDFPFGLQFIYNLARKYNLSTPNIDKVYHWGMSKIKNE